MKWIPTAEYLPDSDINVITFDPTAISEPVWPGFHDGEMWRDSSGHPLKGVTHWMDFPDPPENAMKPA